MSSDVQGSDHVEPAVESASSFEEVCLGDMRQIGITTIHSVFFFFLFGLQGNCPPSVR